MSVREMDIAKFLLTGEKEQKRLLAEEPDRYIGTGIVLGNSYSGSQAEAYGTLVVRHSKEIFGTGDIHYATALCHLGGYYDSKIILGDRVIKEANPESAGKIYEQMLPILESELGTHDKTYLRYLSITAYSYKECGDEERAKYHKDRYDRLWQEQMARFTLCDHIKPIEDYVISCGAKILDRGHLWDDNNIISSADVYFGREAIRSKIHLTDCIVDYEFMTHGGFRYGFQCKLHGDILTGIHPFVGVTNKLTIS